MKHIRLTVRQDEYGHTGFIINGTPSFEGLSASTDGLTIAHDILEHQNGLRDMGPVWDEAEALGGVWYVRGQHGDLGTPHNPNPAYHLGADIQRMFSQWTEEGEYCGPGGLRVGSRPCDYDEDFADCIDKARKMIRDEDGSDIFPQTRAEFNAAVERYLVFILHRMRSGFRKAKRRFERDGSSRFYANSLFHAIKDAVSKAARHIDYEGQEYRLSYGYDRDEGATARVLEMISEEY